MAEKKTNKTTDTVNEDTVNTGTSNLDEILKRLDNLEKENATLKAEKAKSTDTPTVVSTSKKRSPLLNKKVTIELIDNGDTSLHKDSSQATLLTGAAKSFTVPLNSLGKLVNPLEPWEREYLEEVLGIDLNINAINTKDNPNANFWTTRAASVNLRKTSRNLSSAALTLDLNDPHQFILYKIAKVNPRVANSWKERYDKPGEYEFVIKDGEVEFVEELDKTEIEAEVVNYLITNKKSKKKLFDLIRLYGIEKVANQIKYSSDTDFMFNELWKVTKKPNQIQKLYDIIKLGEKDVSERVFLADAVTVGLIEKRGWDYRLSGGDKIGSNEDEAIAYLEDPRNQSTKLRIQMKIEQFYNDK